MLLAEVNAPQGAVTDLEWQDLLDGVRYAVAEAMSTPTDQVQVTAVDVRVILRPPKSSRSRSVVWVTVRAPDTAELMATIPARLGQIMQRVSATIPDHAVADGMQPLSVLFVPTPERFCL